MSKTEKIVNIKNAVKEALMQYDAENVDIMRNYETGCIDIVYHSRHNSFGIVDNVCSFEGLSECDIDNIADCYSIGYCW